MTTEKRCCDVCGEPKDDVRWIEYPTDYRESPREGDWVCLDCAPTWNAYEPDGED